MSIHLKQKQYENKVKRFENLLNRALNGLNGTFQISSASYNINIRIRASRNIDNVINMINEKNSNLTIYKAFENENIVLYQGYIKKDEYL